MMMALTQLQGMMKNKLILNGRYGERHTLKQVYPGKYSLESDFISVSFDSGSGEIMSVDPPGGPYITVGFEFKEGRHKYKVVGFSTMYEPLLIEIEGVD